MKYFRRLAELNILWLLQPHFFACEWTTKQPTHKEQHVKEVRLYRTAELALSRIVGMVACNDDPGHDQDPSR